jgi:GTP cyclohydrolase IA
VPDELGRYGRTEVVWCTSCRAQMQMVMSKGFGGLGGYVPVCTNERCTMAPKGGVTASTVVPAFPGEPGDCTECGMPAGTHLLECSVLIEERREIEQRQRPLAPAVVLPELIPADPPAREVEVFRVAGKGSYLVPALKPQLGMSLQDSIHTMVQTVAGGRLDGRLTAAALRVVQEGGLPGDQFEQRAALEEIGRLLLLTLGQDLTDASLRETPRRWARWWQEFMGYQDSNTDTAFESVTDDQMVVVRGVRVWSLCEHHLLPFNCDVTMAYLPTDRILGLSKFARIAKLHARRLQVQERLTANIADHIQRVTGSPDIAVTGEGEHLCMTMRGAQAPATMCSSVLRGRFRDDPRTRQEFLHLAGKGRPVTGA